MKRTILISLLAFMIMPLMAQKPLPQDCNIFTMEQPDQVTRFILTNKTTGDVEYRGYMMDVMDNRDGVLTFYDPVRETTTVINPYADNSGPSFTVMPPDWYLLCNCYVCGWRFCAPYTSSCFRCPYCEGSDCGGNMTSCRHMCYCQVMNFD